MWTPLSRASGLAGVRQPRRSSARWRWHRRRPWRHSPTSGHGPSLGSIRRPGHPHRVRGTRRHPGAGRPATERERRDPRRRLEWPDDARPPARRRGTGLRLDRGLARPVAQLRPGRGGRPRRSARMARGHHPRDARRGPGHRWRAAGRTLGRPARPRPARWSSGRHGQARPHRRPARPAGGARPALGDALRRARAAR